MNDNRRHYQSLIDRFGTRILFDTDHYPEYSRDASEVNVKPGCLFFAENETDVIDAVTLCRESSIPIVFRGAGTGYTGGAVPVPDGLVLSLEKLRKLEIDIVGRRAFCGSGVITIDVMREAEKAGLFYPPDPASYDESTLGGNVAENAGGLHCKKYGVTRDYIIGLRAVTARGELLTTGVFANHELFNLTGVLIGSEGLLAAITEIAVRLIDFDRTGPTILAAFDNAENAARTVADITRSGIIPSVMEYLDRDAVVCSNRYETTVEIDRAEAVLLFETSGPDASATATRIHDICRSHAAVLLQREDDPEQAAPLWKVRRNLSKAVKASAEQKIAEDVCVPPSRLPELVAFVAELNARLPLRVNSYGHAGDGNLHVNFLVEEPERVDQALINNAIGGLFAKTLALGGTLTGEHGIGLSKKAFLHLEFDAATRAHMKKVKEVFDPDGILNPGKMFV
ncbi:MAG: FAD-binding protein [candidate division Zixibacteria bacterium]|nr:FAD-binding protein [candidate division Zixibacteria bacterium]